MALLDGDEPWQATLREAFLSLGDRSVSAHEAIGVFGMPVGLDQTWGGYVRRTQRAAYIQPDETTLGKIVPEVVGSTTLCRETFGQGTPTAVCH